MEYYKTPKGPTTRARARLREARDAARATAVPAPLHRQPPVARLSPPALPPGRLPPAVHPLAGHDHPSPPLRSVGTPHRRFAGTPPPRLPDSRGSPGTPHQRGARTPGHPSTHDSASSTSLKSEGTPAASTPSSTASPPPPPTPTATASEASPIRPSDSSLDRLPTAQPSGSAGVPNGSIVASAQSPPSPSSPVQSRAQWNFGQYGRTRVSWSPMPRVEYPSVEGMDLNRTPSAGRTLPRGLDLRLPTRSTPSSSSNSVGSTQSSKSEEDSDTQECTDETQTCRSLSSTTVATAEETEDVSARADEGLLVADETDRLGDGRTDAQGPQDRADVAAQEQLQPTWAEKHNLLRQAAVRVQPANYGYGGSDLAFVLKTQLLFDSFALVAGSSATRLPYVGNLQTFNITVCGLNPLNVARRLRNQLRPANNLRGCAQIVTYLGVQEVSLDDLLSTACGCQDNRGEDVMVTPRTPRLCLLKGIALSACSVCSQDTRFHDVVHRALLAPACIAHPIGTDWNIPELEPISVWPPVISTNTEVFEYMVIRNNLDYAIRVRVTAEEHVVSADPNITIPRQKKMSLGFRRIGTAQTKCVIRFVIDEMTIAALAVK